MTEDQKLRLEFIGIDEDCKETLKSLGPVLEQNIDLILGRFYDNVYKYDFLKQKFSRSVSEMKGAQKKHWTHLFGASFDEQYYYSTQMIGKAHVKINLEPRWYIGGYAFVLCEMIDMMEQEFKKDKSKLAPSLKAVIKAVMLDMDLALTDYIKGDGGERLRSQFTAMQATLKETTDTSSKVMMERMKHMIKQSDNMLRNMDQVESSLEENYTAAGKTNQLVESVSNTSRELSAAIKEISDQVSRSSQITNEAVYHTNTANERIEDLVKAAETIGEVIKIINKIASQTNLLALNATIEAARAGDAGKGFAVVASEVKALAGQTEKATQEITQQVARIQDITNTTFEVFKNVGRTVNEVNEISTIISGAVEEQNAATAEIANNIENVRLETSQSQERVKQVVEVSHQTKGATQEVKQAMDQVEQQVKLLNESLAKILGGPGEGKTAA